MFVDFMTSTCMSETGEVSMFDSDSRNGKDDFDQIAIAALDRTDFEVFVAYLDDHLADNGAGGSPYFQPLSREQSHFSGHRAEAFRNALAIPDGQEGWRRLWLARTPAGKIVGHVDLKAHPDRQATHRCMLGMGVDRNYRRLGLGSRLMAHAEMRAALMTTIEWIDLQVLSANYPAMGLYERSGYVRVGEGPDVFTIDGQTLTQTHMTKRIA
jgi:ribosomal protein S18 acetylase RimI-like enzyme